MPPAARRSRATSTDGRGQPAEVPRRCTARALRSASPRPAAIASPTTRRLVSSWGTGAPTPPARAAARSRSLATRSRAKATGRRLGVLVRRPLVVDERRGDGAVRDHLVGQLPLDAGLLGQHQRLGEGLVEPEHHRVDGELHGRAGPERAEQDDPLRERLQRRPRPARRRPPRRRPSPGSSRPRRWTRCRRPGCRPAPRRSRGRRPRGRGPSPGRPCWCRRPPCPGRSPATSPSSPPVRRPHGRVVGERHDHHVRARPRPRGRCRRR